MRGMQKADRKRTELKALKARVERLDALKMMRFFLFENRDKYGHLDYVLCGQYTGRRRRPAPPRTIRYSLGSDVLPQHRFRSLEAARAIFPHVKVVAEDAA